MIKPEGRDVTIYSLFPNKACLNEECEPRLVLSDAYALNYYWMKTYEGFTIYYPAKIGLRYFDTLKNLPFDEPILVIIESEKRFNKVINVIPKNGTLLFDSEKGYRILNTKFEAYGRLDYTGGRFIIYTAADNAVVKFPGYLVFVDKDGCVPIKIDGCIVNTVVGKGCATCNILLTSTRLFVSKELGVIDISRLRGERIRCEKNKIYVKIHGKTYEVIIESKDPLKASVREIESPPNRYKSMGWKNSELLKHRYHTLLGFLGDALTLARSIYSKYGRYHYVIAIKDGKINTLHKVKAYRNAEYNKVLKALYTDRGLVVVFGVNKADEKKVVIYDDNLEKKHEMKIDYGPILEKDKVHGGLVYERVILNDVAYGLNGEKRTIEKPKGAEFVNGFYVFEDKVYRITEELKLEHIINIEGLSKLRVKIHDGHLIGYDKAGVYVYELDSGELLEEFHVDDNVLNAADYDEYLYVGTSESLLVVKDGELLHEVPKVDVKALSAKGGRLAAILRDIAEPPSWRKDSPLAVKEIQDYKKTETLRIFDRAPKEGKLYDYGEFVRINVGNVNVFLRKDQIF